MSKASKGRRLPGRPTSLNHLKGDEDVTVLRLLLERLPKLAKDVEALARSAIGDVSFEDVADEVEGPIVEPG